MSEQTDGWEDMDEWLDERQEHVILGCHFISAFSSRSTFFFHNFFAEV